MSIMQDWKENRPRLTTTALYLQAEPSIFKCSFAANDPEQNTEKIPSSALNRNSVTIDYTQNCGNNRYFFARLSTTIRS